MTFDEFLKSFAEENKISYEKAKELALKVLMR